MTLPLFPEPAHDPVYPDRVHSVTREHEGLRWFGLGEWDTFAGVAAPDYVIVLGHPDTDRMQGLVDAVRAEYRLVALPGCEVPDEDDLFGTYAKAFDECPDTIDHGDRATDGDVCWTCETQGHRGLFYLAWQETVAVDSDKIPPDYFPVTVWQVNDSIGCY